MTPADGLAFLISAIIEIFLLLILFWIFSLKLIYDLFLSIFSFNILKEIVFLNKSIFSIFFFNYFI